MKDNNSKRLNSLPFLKNKLTISIAASIIVLFLGVGIGAKAFNKPKKIDPQ